MRHSPHIELLREVVEAVLILQDQTDLFYQFRVFEIAPQIGFEFADKERVVGRQRRHERRIDREVVGGRMAGTTGPSVAREGLVEEDDPASGNQLLVGWGNDRAA
jgi:hypothetical protein